MTATRTRSPSVWILPALNVILSLWLLASPYLLQFSLVDAARITNGAFGPLILFAAFSRLAVQTGGRWISWFNVVLGICVAVSPFVLGFAVQTTATINNVVVGLLVAVIAAVGGLLWPSR